MDPNILLQNHGKIAILHLKALTMTMVGIPLLFAAFLGSPYLYTLTISHQEAKFPQSKDNNANILYASYFVCLSLLLYRVS
jgi:hypothetical protein